MDSLYLCKYLINYYKFLILLYTIFLCYILVLFSLFDYFKWLNVNHISTKAWNGHPNSKFEICHLAFQIQYSEFQIPYLEFQIAYFKL